MARLIAKSPADGLLDDTVVIWTTDHGDTIGAVMDKVGLREKRTSTLLLDQSARLFSRVPISCVIDDEIVA